MSLIGGRTSRNRPHFALTRPQIAFELRPKLSKPRDNFLTVNRQMNTNTVPANRHSKLVYTARPPEYNRPSINTDDYFAFLHHSVLFEL